jgi:hypothetical protein
MSVKLLQKDLSEEDRRFIRKWRVGFLIFYGVLGVALVGFAVAATSVRDAAKVQTAAEK